MYLSKLELHGFKSFAEPTELHFDEGITAIVGPNGCGKSNIVDAVRWVIGEQRPTVLRSEKMENVIFNGTARRKPLGMAEVQLTIENNRDVLPTEYSEVTLGRRLFRDGKSEYLLNGTQCRLKDITSLFMDTGMGANAYSVIELKMIDEILSDSTEDRRHMFEEAAGITRYKTRRRQALRKLDNTQADLNRIRDLTDEIGTHVRRLERQAEKAEKLQRYETTLHRLELQLAQVEYDRLTSKQQALREEISELEGQIEQKTQAQSAAEHRLEALRETLEERESVLEKRREALQRHRARVRELEAEQRFQRERVDRARSDRNRLQEAQEEAAEQQDLLTEKQERLVSEIDEAEPARDGAEQQLDEARAARDEARAAAEAQREKVQRLRADEADADDIRAAQQRTLDRLTSRLEMLEEEQQRAQDRRDELGATAEEIEARVEKTRAARDAAEEALNEARAALEEAESARAEHEAALEDARDRLRELERARDAAQAEVDLLEGLVTSYDEFSDTVQFLADHPPPELGELRTVADVLACDEDDRVALDAALGALASCIVVENEAAARAAIATLRKSEQGQATFVVLNRLPDAAPPMALDGAQPLRSIVRTADPAYAPLADALLQHSYLADTLEGAQDAAAEADPPARIYARTGEWVDAAGLVHGGSATTSASPVASRLGRREQLQQARERVRELDAACTDQADIVMERKAALNDVPLEQRREAVREAEADFSQAEKRHERITYEQETQDERRRELDERLDALQDELDEGRREVESRKSALQDAVSQRDAARARRTKAEAALQDAEADERAAANRYSEVHVEAVEARNRLENLQREQERTAERLHDLEERSEARADELETLHDTIESALDRQSELDETIEAVRAERAKRDDAVEAAETDLQQTKQAIADVEARLRTLRQEREQVMRQESQRTVRLTEVKTRREDLVENIREDFEVTLSEADVAVGDDFDEDAARSEVQALRRKVRNLGNVNPLALEEYEEEKERLDFLMEQKDDLEEAEATLQETIEEINTTASERFDATFSEIKASFTEIFNELFEGEATARLELDAPDDPLESDISITAQPRGKRPSTLAQLSSGEKTLTAIALLFAIYLVKPSPFCILDEVDAPLDDANVRRFMNLIRRFEDDTQFILVTHNQRTMALADRMYGITMEEQGVSKLVGVEFDEAVEMVQA